MIKRNWKKIIAIMIVIILSMSIGVYAAILLDAEEVSYNKSGSTITVKAALDELYSKARYPKIGDVVNYDANSNGTYTYTTNNTDTTANDYTGWEYESAAVTFSSADSMVWKIMDINNETGAIKLMSANGTSAFWQKGPASYAHCETILNNISEVYGHGTGATGARSATVEDINYLTGYNPVAEGYGMHTQSYTYGNYWLDLTYENGKVKSYETKAGSSSSPRIQTGEKHYQYTGSDYLSDTTNTYKMIFLDTSGKNKRRYWLASRCVDFNRRAFNMRKVVNGYVYSSETYLASTGTESSYSEPACPVVSLNSNVQLTWDSTNNRWNIS